MNVISQMTGGHAAALESEAAGVRYVATVYGTEVRVVLDPPPTAELFREHVDLAVVADRTTFPAFQRLLDPAAAHTAGFLPPLRLAALRDRFGDRATDPTRLLRVHFAARRRASNIDRYCSVAPLGTCSSLYRGKFLLLAGAAWHLNVREYERYVLDCVEVALHVAASAGCRSIYFAGFGGTDGAFPDRLIARTLGRVRTVERALRRGGFLVYFKYWWPLCDGEIERLATRLTRTAAGRRMTPAGRHHDGW